MQKLGISAKTSFAVAASVCLAGVGGALAHSFTSAMKDMPVICSSGNPDEAPFLAENNAAMDKMMAGMTGEPSGDVDQDFTAMMIPHHQGAIDMAQNELRYGRNEQLRRIAQEIIVEQQQEIAAMRLALGQPLPPSAAATDQINLKQSALAIATHKEP